VWPVEAFTDLGPFATRPGEPIRPLRITIDLGDCDRNSDRGDEFAWTLLQELTTLPDRTRD